MLKALFVNPFVGFCEGFVDQLKACINDLVVLDSEDSVGLPQKMHVVRLLDQEEQDVLEDGPDLTWAAEERPLLDGFDQSPHRHSVMILVSHDRSSLTVFATDSSRLEGNLTRHVGELDHTCLVVDLKNFQRVRLDLQDVTEALEVIKEDKVANVVHLGDRLGYGLSFAKELIKGVLQVGLELFVSS